MSNAQSVPHPRLIPPKARRLRMLRGWMHEEGVGAPAVLSLAWALTAMAGGLLVWAGITHEWLRAVLLLSAALTIRARRALARLGAIMPMDGKDTMSPVGGKQRWGERLQQALIILAAGFCAYGSGFLWPGPLLGGLAAALILFGGFITRKQSHLMTPARPDPAMLMAMFSTAAAAEPLWGWRGQIIVLGLLAVCAVLSLRLFQRLRPAA